MSITSELDISRLQTEAKTYIQNSDNKDALTSRQIRRVLEKLLGLETSALDDAAVKSDVKKAIETAFMEVFREPEQQRIAVDANTDKKPSGIDSNTSQPGKSKRKPLTKEKRSVKSRKKEVSEEENGDDEEHFVSPRKHRRLSQGKRKAIVDNSDSEDGSYISKSVKRSKPGELSNNEAKSSSVRDSDDEKPSTDEKGELVECPETKKQEMNDEELSEVEDDDQPIQRKRKQQKKTDAAKPTKKEETVKDEEMSELEDDDQPNQRKRKRQRKKDAAKPAKKEEIVKDEDASKVSKRQQDDENEAEMSEVEDPVEPIETKQQPHKKRGVPTKAKEKSSKKRTPAAKTTPKATVSGVDVELSPSETESVQSLKKFITACGVRKIWSKELAGLKTGKDLIAKLRGMLAELGISERPTLEKCKKIKARRELQAELNSIDSSNIIEDVDEAKNARRARAQRGVYKASKSSEKKENHESVIESDKARDLEESIEEEVGEEKEEKKEEEKEDEEEEKEEKEKEEEDEEEEEEEEEEDEEDVYTESESD